MELLMITLQTITNLMVQLVYDLASCTNIADIMTVSAEGSGFGLESLINDHIVSLSDKLQEFGVRHVTSFTGAARALAAIFSIILVAGQAYRMMLKGEGIDVMQLIKPILLSFVLANWGVVVNTIIAPGAAIESHFHDLYEETRVETERLRTERTNKARELQDELAARNAAAEKIDKSEAASGVSETWNNLMDIFSGEKLKQITTSISATFFSYIMKWLEEIIVALGGIAFQIGVYLMFLMKSIYITVLAMFGPVYIACSILPAWKDCWQQWVSRIITVSMYGALAYLVMAFSMQLIAHCLEQDLIMLQSIVNTGGGVLAYAQGAFGTTCMTIVAYFVGSLAMLSVPEMASWVFPNGNMSTGASSFVGGMGGYAYRGAQKGIGSIVKK